MPVRYQRNAYPRLPVSHGEVRAMTTAAIADLLHGRPAGRGKWEARCPAHRDRNPSLAIREGKDGKTILHCFAGCLTVAVLEAAGLRMADLFAGPPPTPEQARDAALVRARRDAEALQARHEHRRLADRYRKLQAVWEAIAARLARMPDGTESDAIAKLFHSTLEKVRACEELFEAEEQRLFHERLVRKSEQVREAA
jgi:hypothetical protein